MKTVFVTGGAGYVGSALVPELLRRGYYVRVLDLYLFGKESLQSVRKHPRLKEIKGDIRCQDLLRKSLLGCDAVVHLACISNDESVDLDLKLSRSINQDAFPPLVRICKEKKVRRFIFASSAGIYGISGINEVTEDHPLKPVTDYNRFKTFCEAVLWQERTPGFTPVSIRPATICGYSPRMRLDLVVNILTNQAVNLGQITVLGGFQMRPNIHLDDMVSLYAMLLEAPEKKISGKFFNAGCRNHSVSEIAHLVKDTVGLKTPKKNEIKIETLPSDDMRSYHISAEKLRRELGFSPRRSIEDAVSDMVSAFRGGKIPNPLNDSRYYNAKRMREIILE